MGKQNQMEKGVGSSLSWEGMGKMKYECSGISYCILPLSSRTLGFSLSLVAIPSTFLISLTHEPKYEDKENPWGEGGGSPNH